jgi:hypothetical protein
MDQKPLDFAEFTVSPAKLDRVSFAEPLAVDAHLGDNATDLTS